MGIAPHFPLATALTVGIIAIAGTLLIHTLETVATVNVFRRERRLGHVGRSFTTNVMIVFLSVSLHS